MSIFDKWPNFNPEMQISHTCGNCCTIEAKANLSGGITVKPIFDHISTEQIAADVGEFYAWHAMQVHHQLPHFSGYDNIKVTIVSGGA